MERDEATTTTPLRRYADTMRAGGGAGSGGGAGLIVGSATDVAERDADRLADDVMRRLHDPATSAAAAGQDGPGADAGRVRRSALASAGTIGPEGGELDGDTSARIDSARGGGSPLDAGTRSSMEAGFGADFGRVRLHTGAQATQLNDSMQAQAFTVGSDVFLHDRAPRPTSSAGQHLLAHELAHTLQQGGGAARQIHRRIWDSETFMKRTSQSAVTKTSSRQKAIRDLLDSYHVAYPATMFVSSSPPTSTQLKAAEERVAEMRSVAQMWIDEHTRTTTSDETVADGSRKGRREGMDLFIQSCNSELVMIRQLGDMAAGKAFSADHDVSNIAITNPSDRFSKVEAKADGDLTSGFRKLGWLIDMAAPLDGDAAKIAIEIKIPIPPGPGYVGLEMSASASRDGGNVSVETNLGVTGGATVDVASIGGALGCYLKATAKSGADVAELLSYGVFRRSRQSNLIPREVENVLWGGGHAKAFGWATAEEWSLGVEKRILAGNADANVESGAYAGAKAKVSLSKLASVEGELKGTIGTKIDEKTLQARKGGAGKANLKSGTSGALDTSTSRGAQKSVGVGVGGFELSFTGNVGPMAGNIKVGVGWSSDGAHGDKTVKWDTFKVGAGLSFTMPAGELLAGGVGNLIPKLVESINKAIRTSAAETEARSGARAAGNGLNEVAGWATTVAGLSNVPASDWAPFADPAAAAAGTSFSMTNKYTLAVEFDFKKPSMSITLNQVKGGSLAETVADAAGGTTDVFKLDIERTSRLLKISHQHGKGWSVT